MATWPTPDTKAPRVWAQKIFALDGDPSAQRELFDKLDEKIQKWVTIHLKAAYRKRKEVERQRGNLINKLQRGE